MFGKDIKKKEIKVLVHNGRFHADEVCAVALLNVFGQELFGLGSIINVYRVKHANDFKQLEENLKEITALKLKDFDFVIDTGKEYNPEKGYFDHHQDKNLDSACYLVWKYIKDTLGLDDSLYKDLNYIVESISNADIGTTPAKPGELSNIIANFNNIELDREIISGQEFFRFTNALDFVKKYFVTFKKEASDVNELINSGYISNQLRLDEAPTVMIIDEKKPDSLSRIMYGDFIKHTEAFAWLNDDGITYSIKTLSKNKDTYEKVGRSLPKDNTMDFVHETGFYAKAKDRDTMINYIKKHFSYGKISSKTKQDITSFKSKEFDVDACNFEFAVPCPFTFNFSYILDVEVDSVAWKKDENFVIVHEEDSDYLSFKNLKEEIDVAKYKDIYLDIEIILKTDDDDKVKCFRGKDNKILFFRHNDDYYYHENILAFFKIKEVR